MHANAAATKAAAQIEWYDNSEEAAGAAAQAALPEASAEAPAQLVTPAKILESIWQLSKTSDNIKNKEKR